MPIKPFTPNGLLTAGLVLLMTALPARANTTHRGPCKPLPGIRLEWVRPTGMTPGEMVTVQLTIRSEVAGTPVRVSVTVPEAWGVTGPVPGYSGVPDVGATVTVPLTVRVPFGRPDPVVATAQAGTGAGFRVAAALRPDTPRDVPVRPRRGMTATGDPVEIHTAGHPRANDVVRTRTLPRGVRPVWGPAPTAADQVSVTGTVYYRDREFNEDGFLFPADSPELNPLRPVRRALVELLQGQNVIGEQVTGDDGSFSFPVNDGPDYRVRVSSRTHVSVQPQLQVFRAANQKTLFAVESQVANKPSNDASTLDVGDIVVEPGAGGEAFNVLDCCLDAAVFLEALRGQATNHLITIYWNENSNDGTYYSSGSRSIHLLDEEGYDDSVIIHEFGHYVSRDYSSDNSPGGQHFINDSNQDPRLSWSEGWASYWQSLTRSARGDGNPSWYVDVYINPNTQQEELFFSYDCEGPSLGVSGAASEVAVQALLWDIVDGADTPDPSPGVDDDPLDRPLGEMWETMTGPVRTSSTITLEDFWDGWFTAGNGNDAEMRETFTALRVDYFADDLEPDNNFNAARVLSLDGTSVHHTFFPDGDGDYHRFDLEAGQPLTVETLNLMNAVSTAIDVYGPDLNPIGSAPVRSDRTSIAFSATTSGTYFVRVRRGSVGTSAYTKYGAYDLRAVRGTPNNVTLNSVGGVAMVDNAGFSVGAAFADYDLDGYPDLFVVNNAAGGFPNDQDALYRNQRNGTFVATTGSAGAGGSEGGIAAAFADYDNDGDPDLFLTDHGFYRNLGNGSFGDVTQQNGIPPDLGREFDAAWADADRDGFLDLFVAMRDRPSVLWRGSAGGGFQDVTEASGLVFPADGEDQYSAVWGDYDADGAPDLFVTYVSSAGHGLFHNLGDGTFEDVTAAAGVASEEGAVGGVWGDVNGDGMLDLFVCSTGNNRLYINQGDGTFLDDAPRYGVNAAEGSRGAGFADYDLDGDLDLYVVNFNGANTLYENLGGAMLQSSQGALSGLGHACAFADFDLDGDPDIYVARQGDKNLLLQNQRNIGQGTDAPWLQVALRGRVSNRDGLGARILVHSGGKVQLREVGTGVGWAAKSRVPEVFGIPAGLVDSVLVTWPSGRTNVVRGPSINSLLRVDEQDAVPVLPPNGRPFLLNPGPAFPNPFTGATTVRFELSQAALVRLEIFDVRGRRVTDVVERRYEAGFHVLGWDGRDALGNEVPGGVYFYRLEAGEASSVRKLIRVTR